jgi:predicted nuclease with RNAse H fold
VSERRGLDIVVLGADLRLVEPPRARQTAADLGAVLENLRPACVAIDSPPSFGTEGSSRQCERDLAALGLPSFRTPSDPQQCLNPFYNWMRAGHEAFAAAASAGYPLFRNGDSVTGCALEVFPHAAAVALTGSRPPPGSSRNPAEKRRWRLAALARAGVETAALRTLDAVDAALAALAGLYAYRDEWFSVGDPKEGMIIVPGSRPTGPYPRSQN